MSDTSDKDAERIAIYLTPALIGEIDDFQFGWRIKTRSAAIRRLIKSGLRREKELCEKPNSPRGHSNKG
jgi:metal-responsive CopG/Arc/MetJ family transcriptional regulator